MKLLLPILLLPLLAGATTITVLPIHEPLSLHGTDNDEITTEVGEALQACVLSRPMALTGDFPETLVTSIRTPHAFPTNNPNYQVREANLLILTGITLDAESTEQGLTIRILCHNLRIPTDVDLTARQVLRLTIVAIRKTLEEYQKIQTHPLRVHLLIEATGDAKEHLEALGTTFQIPGAASK
jgi:hypothetical protein